MCIITFPKAVIYFKLSRLTNIARHISHFIVHFQNLQNDRESYASYVLVPKMLPFFKQLAVKRIDIPSGMCFFFIWCSQYIFPGCPQTQEQCSCTLPASCGNLFGLFHCQCTQVVCRQVVYLQKLSMTHLLLEVTS